MTLDPRHVWSAILTDFMASNETVLHHEEVGDGESELHYGLQATLFHRHSIHDTDVIGYPDDVFVTAPAIAKLLGCAPATARRWLDRFHAHGLLERHGDMDIEGRPEFLYIPVFEDAGSVITVLDDLGDRPTGGSSTHLRQVTPGDFEPTDTSGVFRHREDSSITVDVRDDDTQRSIKERIEEQLGAEGFAPSSPHNFAYQLRDRAGLTASDQRRQQRSGGGGDPEPFESSTCYIDLASQGSAIKGATQAEAMANFVEHLLHETDFLEDHSLPWAPGRGYRAIINDNPRHRNGEQMDDREYEMVRGGYYVYIKLKSEDKQRYIRQLAESVGDKVTGFSGGW